MDKESVNGFIYNRLLGTEAFMAARCGSVEIKPTIYYLVLKNKTFIEKSLLYINGDADYVLNDEDYVSYMAGIMNTCAGFFPKDGHSLQKFAELMSADLPQIDLCGCWLNEKLLEDYFSPEAEFCELGALEPYDYDNPWTLALVGRKVLVIHPFAKTIETQYERRAGIWPDKDVLPDFDLYTIKAIQTLGSDGLGFATWFDALDDMKRQMDAIDYEVALIGCGAYGLPLAAHAKRRGKKAVHLGGPLQILFGIKGRRWDAMPSVSGLYNDYWVRPSTEETPSSSIHVEGGCYW